MVTMSSVQAVGAEFDPIPQFPLDVTTSGTGQGTVTSYAPGISCPGTCSASFDKDSTVYLLAAPAPSSSLAGFSGAGCSGTATICAVEMGQAQFVSAGFRSGSQGASLAGTRVLGASFTVEKIVVRDSTATLRLAVPEVGTVFAAGRGLKRAQARTSAGTAVLHLSLNAQARGALARARHYWRLRVGVTLAFVSESGDMESITKVIQFTPHSGSAKIVRGTRRRQG
jgi:hypothetical protein